MAQISFNPYRKDSESSETTEGIQGLPHFHGLSMCCYAPLLPFMEHFTCSDCSTLFNKVK